MRAHLQRLVQLLVIFDKQHPGAGVLAQVLHLGRGVGRVDAVGHTAAAQHGQITQHPFNHRVGQDGGAGLGLKAQAQQAAGNFAHRGAGLVPAPAAPDAQLLLPQPGLVAALGDGVPEQRGQGVARHDDVCAWAKVGKIPKVAHGRTAAGMVHWCMSTSSSCASSSAARRARRLP